MVSELRQFYENTKLSALAHIVRDEEIVLKAKLSKKYEQGRLNTIDEIYYILDDQNEEE